MIPVTKSFIPDINEYQIQVKRAFDNGWLTNRGELVLELEEKLKTYLEIEKILITNNGTIPLQIALKLLGQGGEIITTPFSYVATTAAIVWENCTPVFVDINPTNFNIDESKIEAAITDKTTCILATHVFGIPCNIEEIERIAKKHRLKVIYDGAHAFGVKYKGKSIFTYGDIATCSFHATKLFHTGEGGAIFSKDDELYDKIYYSHNFGHNGPLAFHGLGINGKISELQAAMGLTVFPHLDFIISERKKIVDLYLSLLDFNFLEKQHISAETEWNFSYFPVVFKDEETLLKIEKELNHFEIVPRRYFYPSLNNLPYVNGELCALSENLSSRILCLPLFVGLEKQQITHICSIINSSIQ